MGDMAGDTTVGGNADPINTYKMIRDSAKALYFVQGNHDTYNDYAQNMKNPDGTWCCVVSPIGKISGINGIASDKKMDPNLHIYSSTVYNKRLEEVLNGDFDIFLSHQPNPNLTKLESKVYLCGHHHCNDTFLLKGFVNCDGRILDIT